MDSTEENWLPIVGYENYKVSDLGRVKNKHGKILKLQINPNKYFHLQLWNNKIKKILLIHRLVLLTFLPIDEIKEVNHKNHITTDNRLENLEWCSRSENNRFKKKREGLSSQYNGVSWDKNRNKWKVDCRINKKGYNIGRFDDEHDAGRAYNEFVIKHNLQHFTILNVIQ